MHNRLLGLGLLAIFVAASVSGCVSTRLSIVTGSGTQATETRNVDDFTEIKFLGAGRIDVTIGEPQALELSGDDNILPLIETEVTGGKLVIKPTRAIRTTTPLVLTITVPDVTSLQLDGAGDINITGIDNTRLSVEVAGAGNVMLNGQTENLTINLTGAGRANAENLPAGDVLVTLSGVGQVHVNAVDALDVTITGVGSVTYSGNPEITQNITGLGSLRRAE